MFDVNTSIAGIVINTGGFICSVIGQVERKWEKMKGTFMESIFYITALN